MELTGKLTLGAPLKLVGIHAIACLSAGQGLEGQGGAKAHQNGEEKPRSSCSVPPAPSADKAQHGASWQRANVEQDPVPGSQTGQ